MTSVEVKLSQESLFFPLPFTNATIENVVQIKNLLTPDKENRKVNVIAFKVLSAVRHRYSVRPAIGFVAPGEAVTINFSLDPESIRSNPDPASRVLPTEKTNDSVYIDFAVVVSGAGGDSSTSEAANGKYLSAWLAAGGAVKGVNDRRSVMDEASRFWKSRGAAKNGGDDSSLRKKLACVFTARDAVPDSLVVCMKAEGSTGASVSRPSASQAPAPPTTRPPATVSTHRNSTAPPDALPRRFSEGQPTPTASATPRASVGVTRQASEQLANGGGTVGRVSPSPAEPQPNSNPAIPSPAGPPPSTASAIRKPLSLQKAAMLFSGEKAEKRKALWKTVMNYRVPYVIAVVFIVLAFLCGLFETHTFLSWLIAGK